MKLFDNDLEALFSELDKSVCREVPCIGGGTHSSRTWLVPLGLLHEKLRGAVRVARNTLEFARRTAASRAVRRVN